MCNSCGAAFAIDYDESDVEYERLQIESEQRQAQRERQKSAGDAAKKTIAVVIMFAILASMGIGIFFLARYIAYKGGSRSSGAGIVATPTPAPNYSVTPDDLTADMDQLIEAGRKTQMNIDKCAYWDKVGAVKYFDKTDAVFLDAYIITDIPNVRENQSNRIVLIYEVTWHNDKLGDQKCYDAVYFQGVKVNPDGGIICDYNARTIMRSDAAWGYAMAYSYEDYDTCYLENVTAVGGKVTKVGS